MYLGRKLSNELNIVLYRNDGDSQQHSESITALQNYELNQKRNEAIRADKRSELLSKLTGKTVVVKPERVEFSANRTQKILNKSQNEFWQDSLYSYDLLRMLRGAVMHGVRSFNHYLANKGVKFQVALSAQDLKTIAEDVIPHVLTMELEDTNYAKRFIKNGQDVPRIDTVERFLDCLFSECFNWAYILPNNDKAGERCNVIGRQLRLGIGHVTSVTDDIADWLDGEQLPTRGIVQSQPFDIESLKLLLNAECQSVIDYVMSPANADKQLQSFMSQSTVELLLNCSNRHARNIISKIIVAAKQLQK